MAAGKAASAIVAPPTGVPQLKQNAITHPIKSNDGIHNAPPPPQAAQIGRPIRRVDRLWPPASVRDAAEGPGDGPAMGRRWGASGRFRSEEGAVRGRAGGGGTIVT